MNTDFDVIILGAGGAGLMCAAVAGQNGSRVLLLDHADKPGKKILISGGGRCNFTNLDVSAGNFLSANPHFAKSALKRYAPADFIDLVEKHGIAWHEKTLGQLFCDKSAKQIVDMLVAECEAGKVVLHLGQAVRSVQRGETGFVVKFGDTEFHASSLVIATGGPSIPKLGATGFAYDLARQFGLKVVEPRPALVPLTLPANEALFRELSGVATPVRARAGRGEFREAALFTHKGMSGPAILQVSSYWRHGEAVKIDFLPDLSGDWLIREKCGRPRLHLKSVLAEHLPARLADTLCERLGEEFGTTRELGNVSDRDLTGVQERLADWRFEPDGTEGFAKAEVTIGGISTAELSSKTMEAKKVPGLYCIGEAVDVTGWLGGYNFQWAWASGHAAGRAVAERLV